MGNKELEALKLSDLAGEHVFEIVPKTDLRHPISGDASGVIFELGEMTYLVFEDESDGYRSNAGPLLSYRGSAYEMGSGREYSFPTYIREEVICTHRDKSIPYEGGDQEDDVLEVRSKITGEIIFEVGTENIDDYYPSYICRWQPENLSANAKARVNV